MSVKRGYVVGETSSSTIDTVTSEPFAVGEYATVESEAGPVLGVVEESTIHSVMLSDNSNFANFEDTSELVDITSKNTRDKRYMSRISLITSLDAISRRRSEIPAIPPEPGRLVYGTRPEDLASVFARDGPSHARIGSLLRNAEIQVKVDLDKVASRHVGILAMTGMGKSNTVSLLVREMVKRDGTVVIFDYHDDYATLGLRRTNVLTAKVNPRHLGFEELADMLDFRANADKQLSMLENALTKDVRSTKGDFWNALIDSVNDLTDSKNNATGRRVIEKIRYAVERMGEMLDPDTPNPMSLIKVGHANILSTSAFTDKQANAALAFYMRKILEDRKEATVSRRHGRSTDSMFAAPVFVVIEEAHAFIPKDRDTAAKYWASRIAREGRKFGVGLCIVSQRPRGIDINVLSQMGSFAAMRMIQPDDQKQVEAAAESVGRALVGQLSTLGVGEAILTGQWIALDAMVRVDEVKEKTAGADQSAVAEWSAESKKRKAGIEKTGDLTETDLLI